MKWIIMFCHKAAFYYYYYYYDTLCFKMNIRPVNANRRKFFSSLLKFICCIAKITSEWLVLKITKYELWKLSTRYRNGKSHLSDLGMNKIKKQKEISNSTEMLSCSECVCVFFFFGRFLNINEMPLIII